MFGSWSWKDRRLVALAGVLGLSACSGGGQSVKLEADASAGGEAAAANRPQCANEDRFVSKAAGFEVCKPSGWVFVEEGFFRDHLGDLTYRDTEFAKKAVKDAKAPLISFVSQEAASEEDVRPGVAVGFTRVGSLGLADVAAMVVRQGGQMWEDYEVTDGPQSTQVDGLPAKLVKVRYTQETSDGGGFLWAADVWLIKRGEDIFTVSAGAPTNQYGPAQETFQDVVQSIAIER